MPKSKDSPLSAAASGGAAGSNTVRRLRLRISAAAESTLRSGHPWLFADSIRDQNRPGEVGELAVIYDRKDRFLAMGLFDPGSPIRVRILHAGKPRNVDRAFWGELLEQALIKRDGLFDSQTTGFRWINGESDGWPGLVLDRYGGTLVLKIYTPAWLAWLPQILEVLSERLQPDRIVLRLSRNSIPIAINRFANSDGQVVSGKPIVETVTFLETGLFFEAEVLHGQKTGFFLDQRENRRKIETMSASRSVLNAFSFSGGFSLYAARGGARSVTDLDISAHALAAAERNFTLNKTNRIINACMRKKVQADAFEWLAANRSPMFDMVILDPPSLAKRETERERAVSAYRRLALLGLKLLRPQGVLLACSCSAHVSEQEFFETVRAAARTTARRYTELARTTHAPDHPATIPEAKYLKAMYLTVP